MTTIQFLNKPLSTSVSNNTTANTTDLFYVIWLLSRAMKKAGWTYWASSDGTTKDTSNNFANDKWGGNSDPATDVYPGFNNKQAWWNAQGPSTLKIPITSASTGSFIIGEKITQATTGAKGELRGYLFDIPTGAGYLVVSPRVDGSGADPHGWDHTHVITGHFSGATITPSSTILEYVREVVFWKAAVNNQNTDGNSYYQCVNNATENASRFSVLSGNVNCTGSIAPGGSTSAGNLFPLVGSWVMNGTGTPNTFTTNRWTNHSPSTGQNQCHVVALNALYSDGYSADGSFWFAVGNPTSLGTDNGDYDGWMLSILDNTEPGDVDPYAMFLPTNDSTYTTIPVAAPSQNPKVGSTYNGTNSQLFGSMTYRFWAGRGLPGEGFTNAFGALLTVGQGGSNTPMFGLNTTDREILACTYPTLTTYLSEDLWVISHQAYFRTRKGTMRWLRAVCVGGNASGTDTYGSKSWVQLCDNGNASNIPLVAGPWDGYTVPIGTH